MLKAESPRVKRVAKKESGWRESEGSEREGNATAMTGLFLTRARKTICSFGMDSGMVGKSPLPLSRAREGMRGSSGNGRGKA